MIARDHTYFFRLESAELLERLEAGLLASKAGGVDVDDLFRAAHTLKGAARAVEKGLVADLAHALEDVLAHHRESGEPLDPKEVDELLVLVDAIRTDLAGTSAAPRSAGDGPVARTDGLRLRTDDVDALTYGIAELDVQGAELRAAVGTTAELRALVAKVSALAARPTNDGRPSPRLRAGLDELSATVTEHARMLRSVSERLDAQLREVGHRAFELRLVALSELVPELERSVHDASRDTGRTVRLAVRGTDTRIDVHVLAKLRVALVHLVRNAIAHGIESREERLGAGKEIAGSVEVSFERRGGRIGMMVRDDGGGLRRAAIVAEARRRGLLTEGDDGLRSVEELIFHPGLSTADAVSELSGRGVGLDAVRSTVESCNGTMRVHSIEGAGTTFEIEVPVSLSATRALVVEAAGEVVLIPIDFVVSTRKIDDSMVTVDADGSSFVDEGRVLPMRDLADALGVEAGSRPRVVTVLRTSAGLVALSVDALLGTRDVVLRPMPRAVGRSRIFSCASIDRGGIPRLVLDPEGLVGDRRRSRFASSRDSVRGKPVLVIDDSLTTRMLEQSILEAVGFEVDVASSAEEGLEKALARDYGLFVCDVEMPGMSGYEFTRETRRIPTLASTPVIMVTSLDSDESRRKGRDAGVATYIVKGEFDQTTFLRAVAELRR